MRAHHMGVAAIAAAALVFGAAGCKMNGHDHHDDDDSKEIVITANDVPAAVASGFKKTYPNVKVQKIVRETYKDGTVHYEYEFTAADGKKQEVELNDKGEVLEDH